MLGAGHVRNAPRDQCILLGILDAIRITQQSSQDTGCRAGRNTRSGIRACQVLGMPLPRLLGSVQDVWTCNEGELDFSDFLSSKRYPGRAQWVGGPEGRRRPRAPLGAWHVGWKFTTNCMGAEQSSVRAQCRPRSSAQHQKGHQKQRRGKKMGLRKGFYLGRHH